MWECDDVNELIVNLEDGLPNIPREGSFDLEQVYTIVQYIDIRIGIQIIS